MEWPAKAYKMRKVENFGYIILFSLVFWLIFQFTGSFLNIIGVHDDAIIVYIYSMIASSAWLYWPRGEGDT